MSFRREWCRFRSRPRTWGPDPGVREAWHGGRPWYEVWVLRVEDPAVEARRAEVARALGAAIAPFSTGSPHVTVWVSGWRSPAHHPPVGTRIPLVVGRVNAFASCPFLEVRAPALVDLRRGFGGPEERWSPFLPHLTVGRFVDARATAPIVTALRPFRALPPVYTVGELVPAWVDTGRDDGELCYSRPP